MPHLPSINPATGEVVGEVPITPATEVQAAVDRARKAQPAWNDLGLDGRATVLKRAAAILNERAAAHGELITREMGKPLREGLAEARSLGESLAREVDEMVEALEPEVLEDGVGRSTVYHDPLGVVGAITPWNFPMSMPSWMVLPALVAGNSVILKPSEETPLCGQAYADALNEVLPAGVLTVVHGADDQGKALVQSNVDMIAFTGSREVGKHILRESSGTLKRVVLELGGKDPMIVLDDADIEKAATFAAFNSFRNCGQVCVSTERIFVLDSIADEFEAALSGLAAAMTVGNGLDDVDVGPMVNAGQRDHVLAQVDAAVASGAIVLTGGRGHHDNFVTPTVLTGVTEAMEIGHIETFGPVACVTRVSSDDEAVQRANDTHFGLGAVVFGGDEARTSAVARRLTAGMIGVNRGVGGVVGTPWVGARESGFGFHKSKDGHRQFTQTRVLTRSL
ncbi:MAG: aldehyde dehydrogenase family protein [Gemmatimonadetes bacterium]|nr:aldehyde dehydrogenase family protein [Gemmatimonadota bacterium]MDA1102766.1 aldehyde dehydrogenase family protein [Gemmatimonadota bacterium]